MTESVGRKLLTLPFHQHLTDADVRRVAAELASAVAEAKADR
ncbi:hypothetical protein ACFWAR_00670 [Streptomyces sp. NPDC059917]